MRVNLKVPFSEKDQAKVLGARWDIARKVWYVKDVEKLEPFLRWMPNVKPPRKPPQPRTTTPEGGFKPLCDCTVLPWEDCIHTEAQTQAILASDYGISSSGNHNG